VTTLLLGLALVVVGGLGIALLELLIRRADVAAALVLGSVVVQAYFIDRVPALVLPGGVQVYITDIVASLVVGAAVLRLLRLPRFDPFQRWLLLLAVLLLVSLVRGGWRRSGCSRAWPTSASTCSSPASPSTSPHSPPPSGSTTASAASGWP
jgi:hypothetical protein